MFLVLGLIVLACLFLAGLALYFKKYKYIIEVTKNIPSPPTLPIIGHGHYFIGKPAHELINKMLEFLEQYGNTMKIWLGPELNVWLSDIRDVEFMLSSMSLIDKAGEYKMLEPWLQEGLLVSHGKKWHKRRKIITPAFHFKILEQFLSTFEKESRKLIENLEIETKIDQPSGINLYNWINLCTLDTISALSHLNKLRIDTKALHGIKTVFLDSLRAMLLVIGCFLCSLLFIGSYLYILKYVRMIHLTREWPSPPSLPIIGHAYHFINKRPEQNMLKMLEFSKIYGDSFKIWLGMELNLILADVRDIEVVLGTTNLNEKASEYVFLQNWLRDGLLISRGRKWFQRRRILTPAFHFKILNEFIDIFERNSRLLVDNLDEVRKQNAPEGIILYDWINLCTLDTIAETAMGVSINAQTDVDSEYVRAVKTIATVLHKRMFDILYRFDLTYKFTKLAREEKKALNILHSFTEKIIMQRREELLKAKDKNENIHADADDVGAKRKMAFLDILLQSEIDGKPLTNLDIREEVDTFMFEGHDTTSSAIMFFFYNIALYPECQQRCIEEIIAVMGKDKSKPVTNEDLNNMSYIELCIKETLRLFPSVPLLGRKVIKECEINGKIIPAGTNIGISPLHLGRLEELFPEANLFKPERFDVVTTAEKMNPYAYIPFSAGPRNCIGQKFAMLEIKTIVVNVLRSFEVSYAGNPSEEPLLIGELILRTKDPLMFRLKPRILG